MIKKIIIPFLLFQVAFVAAQAKVVDYLGIPGPLKVDNQTYYLSWSSHPTAQYYKHEYLQAIDNVDRYNKMIMIDFLEGDYKIEDVVNQKIATLDNLKKTNPVINYKVYKDKDEYMLDFLISENSKDGKEVLIAERNVYRYKLVTSGNKKGLLLFAISERGYPENMDQFFNSLKANTATLINTVAKYKLPTIKIK